MDVDDPELVGCGENKEKWTAYRASTTHGRYLIRDHHCHFLGMTNYQEEKEASPSTGLLERISRRVTCRDGVGLRDPIRDTEAPRHRPQWEAINISVPEGINGGPGVAGAQLEAEL